MFGILITVHSILNRCANPICCQFYLKLQRGSSLKDLEPKGTHVAAQSTRRQSRVQRRAHLPVFSSKRRRENGFVRQGKTLGPERLRFI